MTNLHDTTLLPSTEDSAQNFYGVLPAQFKHRINLLAHAPIHSSPKILELGCGQGDCTTVLALNYPSAHITAIDPGPSDYGDPETLSQAQDRIKSYEFGERITFQQTAPIKFLGNAGEDAYDAAVLCHCLWYFRSADDVKATFTALKPKVKKLFIAEWSLNARAPSSHAHVLGALTRAACETHIPHSMENIRTPIAPAAIKALAADAGWTLQNDAIVEPPKDLEDARWEVNMLLMRDAVTGENRFLGRARREVPDQKVVTLLESMVEAVKEAVDRAGGVSELQCMDAWVGTFM